MQPIEHIADSPSSVRIQKIKLGGEKKKAERPRQTLRRGAEWVLVSDSAGYFLPSFPGSWLGLDLC